jgi:thiol-disulfide isomerase/thioredoxin
MRSLSGQAALLSLSLGLFACAHALTGRELLADIHTGAFRLPDSEGRPFELAAHRGHVVVLQFFATWCTPCLAEVNQLKNLSVRGVRDVEIVGVALDVDAARVLPAFKRSAGVEYLLLAGDEETRLGRGPFGKVPELPTTAVLDATGTVRSAFTGLISDADLDRLLDDARRPH